MVSDEIKQYIQKTRKAGYNEDQIRKALHNAGWGDEQIEEALNEMPSAPSPDEKKIKSTDSSSNDTAKPTNTLAIVSLIITFFIPLIGLILAIIALGQIKKRGEHGKALAIIAIVLNILQLLLLPVAFLAYFGVLDPARTLPDRCAFPAGMDCIDKPAVTSDSVTIALRNNIGYPITVDSVTGNDCTYAEMAPSFEADYESLGATVEHEDVFRIRLTGCNNGNTGNKFQSDIRVVYTNTETGLQRTSVGDVRSMVS